MILNLLITTITVALIAMLRRELWAALLEPTPGRAITLMSAAYVVGATLVQWRESSEFSTLLYFAYTANFLAYLLGFYAFSNSLRLRLEPDSPKVLKPRAPWATFGKWFVFSLILSSTIVAVSLVGAYRVPLALFQFLIHGEVDVSVLELRLALASGEERWIAPGYLKQLRDILLPLATLWLLFSVKRSAPVFLVLAFTLIPLVSLVMITSGERAFVLLFLLAAVYAALRCASWNVLPRGAVAAFLGVASLVGASFFAALTLSFTSRYEEGEEINVPLILVDRIVTRAPEENALSASVWSKGAPFPGAGWISDLSTILPGTQKTLSNLLHEELGGGDRGNSILGAWVDVHYNFGWSVGIAVSIVIGAFLAVYTHWVNRTRGLSRAADICGLWLSICTLFVLSPFGFLLYGPFLLTTVLALLAVKSAVLPGPLLTSRPR